ncbi:MAG: serine hydrolase [Vicinamibacterales bacterium]
MRRPVRLPIVLLALTVATAVATTHAQAPVPGLERLRLQIERTMAPARGDVGVSIKHLETGQEVVARADEPYPMASTVKLPILVELYAQERAGKLKLDDMHQLTPADQHVGSGDISVLFDLPGVSMSLSNLANMMMMISDNSATDILLARVGGAAPVNTRMRALGLDGIRVDRTIQELVLDFGGHDTERMKTMLLPELRPLMRRPPLDEAARLARHDQNASDLRDQATPRDMTRLLEMLWRGSVVDPEASKAMLELMKRCRTGAARIKGLLPPDTVVAHKTGSLGGTVDDLGIIYLPDGAGHVAISVLSKRTLADSGDVERVIAELARYAYDYFLFTAPASPSPSGPQ